jgi:hypothetical protein
MSDQDSDSLEVRLRSERQKQLFESTPQTRAGIRESGSVIGGGTYGGGGSEVIDVFYQVGHKLTSITIPINTDPLRDATQKVATQGAQMPTRKRLESERKAVNHAFRIGDLQFYVTVGLYPDGIPGEIFLRVKPTTADVSIDDLPGMEAGRGPGGFASGMCDAFGTMASLALQYGCPLSKLCEKMEHMSFAPAQLGQGKSVMDYLAKWLMKKFPPAQTPTEATHDDKAMAIAVMATAVMPEGADAGQLSPEGSPCYNLDHDKLHPEGKVEPISCACPHHHHGGGDLLFCLDCANRTSPPVPPCYRSVDSDQPGHTIVGCSAKVPV